MFGSDSILYTNGGTNNNSSTPSQVVIETNLISSRKRGFSSIFENHNKDIVKTLLTSKRGDNGDYYIEIRDILPSEILNRAERRVLSTFED